MGLALIAELKDKVRQSMAGEYNLQALLPVLSTGRAITHPLIGEPIKMDSKGQMWIMHMDGPTYVGKSELKMNYFLLVSDKWSLWSDK